MKKNITNQELYQQVQQKIKSILRFTEELQNKIEERYKVSENLVLSEIQIYMLKSERFRVIIIMALLAIAIFHFLILKFFTPEKIIDFLGGEKLIYTYLGILIFYFFYEGIILIRINSLIKKRIRIPNLLRYINAFVEISAPTLFLYILAMNLNSPEGLIFPPYLFYFLVIILTILRLDIYLSIFTGTVAFIEYLLLSIYFINLFEIKSSIPVYFFSIEFYITHGGVFFISGILCGLISKSLKDNIRRAAQIMEDRNEVLEIFGQYVSPEVMNKLLNQKFLDLSEKKKVTVMFLDIRNFTKFSESRDPVEVIHFLNLLFEYMIDIINKYNGIVNKFLGDGFMAIFGAPIETEDDALNAYKASIEIIQTLEELKKQHKIKEVQDWELKIGIGIHTGEAITGNVGSKIRKEYTVIGDTVNTASRIEQLNKKFDSQLLLSKETFDEVLKYESTIDYKDIKKVIVKGKSKPITIYRIV
ncbi:MAG: guanylate cyclase [Leptospiraceae bacterium]|nr:MAG: guanylate cyclase [Leptospiraceae bacterium]